MAILSLLVSFFLIHANGFALPLNFSDAVQNPNPKFESKADNTIGGGGGELWCVAKNNAEDVTLQSALDWACGPGGADCRPIQQGGPCSDPADIQSYASFAFNDYFIKSGVTKDSCDFGGAAAVTSLNPSHGNCVFPSSSSARNGSFSGLTGTIAGVGPAGTDTSGGHILCKWVAPLLMFTSTFVFL